MILFHSIEELSSFKLWIKRTGFPLVRKVEAVHGLSFHTLLGDLSFPETGDYSSPADDEYQIHLVLLK